MSKIGVFSDIHISNHSEFGIPVGYGINSRAVDCLSILNQIKEIAIERGLEAILFCGDLFDTREWISVPIFSSTKQMLEGIGEVCPIFMIAGNHDSVSNSEESLNSVSLLHNGTSIFHIDGSGIDYLNLHIIGLNYKESFDNIVCSNNFPNILLMHDYFAGTSISPQGYIASDGVNLDLLYEYMEEHDIKLTFCGDIHTYSELIRGRVYYVGSPLQKSFGEIDKKGMLILDTDNFDVEFVKLNSPKFITVDYRELSSYNLDDGNYYKVINAPVDFIANTTNIRVASVGSTKVKERSTISLDTDWEEAISKWVDLHGDEDSKEDLLSSGLALLGEASSAKI